MGCSSSVPAGAPHEGLPSSLAGEFSVPAAPVRVSVADCPPGRRVRARGSRAVSMLQEGLPVLEALVRSAGARTLAGADGAAGVRFLFALKGAPCVGLAGWLEGPLVARGFHKRFAALVAAAAVSAPCDVASGPRSFVERESLRFVLATLLRKDRRVAGSALNVRLAEVRSVSAGRVARGVNFGVALPVAPSSSSSSSSSSSNL